MLSIIFVLYMVWHDLSPLLLFPLHAAFIFLLTLNHPPQVMIFALSRNCVSLMFITGSLVGGGGEGMGGHHQDVRDRR